MSRDYRKLIGKQVARIRKEMGLTQAQLAEAIDVAPETISRLERGISIPSLGTLEDISRALDVTLKELFDFEYTTLKTQASPADKELAKVINFLRTKRVNEIRLSYQILKDVFKAVKKMR